jgi:hypothetical protein
MIQRFEEYNKLCEFNNQEMTEQELLEMSNYKGEHFGIEGNVVLWIGSVLSSQHIYGNRIKVSNVPSKGTNDLFTITIPKLEIIGNVNTKHITTKKLNKIFDFIKLNMELIIQFCQEEIDGVEFVQRIKKLE